MMRHLKYAVYQEDKYYVSQCLNVDVASFRETIDGAPSAVLVDSGLFSAASAVSSEFTSGREIKAAIALKKQTQRLPLLFMANAC